MFTCKWHVSLSQTHHQLVGNATGQGKAGADDHCSYRSVFHNNYILYWSTDSQALLSPWHATSKMTYAVWGGALNSTHSLICMGWQG